jgi:hypothetical protein
LVDESCAGDAARVGRDSKAQREAQVRVGFGRELGETEQLIERDDEREGRRQTVVETDAGSEEKWSARNGVEALGIGERKNKARSLIAGLCPIIERDVAYPPPNDTETAPVPRRSGAPRPLDENPG